MLKIFSNLFSIDSIWEADGSCWHCRMFLRTARKEGTNSNLRVA